MLRKDYLPFGKPNFSEEEIDAVARVIRSGWIGMGPETVKFEEELAQFTGAPYLVTVNSCTSALFLALLANGIGPGDEVVVPSLTWCSTANAALYLGATPVFCDVAGDTLSITPELVMERLTPRTKAVMVVHMGGLAVEVAALRKVLPEQVAIIEDAAHGLGSKFADGRPVGSSGNLTCFSFYANKNLSTAEGGAIALFDEDKAARLASLRQHRLTADAWKRFTHPQCALVPGVEELGYKMNFTDLQASIGRVQLRRQQEFHAIRLDIAKRYCEILPQIHPLLNCQVNLLHPYHARHLFQIILPLEEMTITRNDLLLQLRERNVGASIHYAPLHFMPLYADKRVSLPRTESVCNRIMTLPISASMTVADADYVLEQLQELIG